MARRQRQMCIRDRSQAIQHVTQGVSGAREANDQLAEELHRVREMHASSTVSYTHLRAHETVLDLVCRLLLEKKKQQQQLHTTVTQT